MPPLASEVPPGATLDMREMLARGARAAGARVLLRDTAGSRTGAELLESVPRIAAQLAAINGGRGHVVLIDAAPCIATLEAYWACLHAGLVPLLVPRDGSPEQVAPALAGLELRGAFAMGPERISQLAMLGAEAGLAAFDSTGGYPPGWTRLSAGGTPMPAREACLDDELCALALFLDADGKAAISARSHRTVALTGLMGQFLLAPGEGEVVVVGNPGGALLEWALHCAILARVPISWAGTEGMPPAPESSGWQLAVAAAPAYEPLVQRAATGNASAAMRTALVRDCTFEPRPEHDGVAAVDLELCTSDEGGFLFTRHRQRATAGWFSAPLTEAAASTMLPARTLAHALALQVSSPQRGLEVKNAQTLGPRAQLGRGAAADVGTLMRSAAAQQPDAPALIQDGVVLSHGEFVRRAAQLSALLRERYGVQAGDRVAFLALNRPEFFETYLAAVQIGAIFAPLNFRLSAAEVRVVLDDCAPRVLIAEAEVVQRFEGTLDWLPKEVQLLSMAQRGASPCAYNRELEAQQPLTEFVRGHDEDPSSILYTTGTTGTPKGAVRSHKSVIWFTLVYGPLSLREEPDATHLATPPLFHIAGHETAPLPALALGRKVVIQRRFDPEMMLSDIERYSVTSAFAPPTVAIELVQRLRVHPVDLSSLRDWSSGSAPVSVESRDAICAAAPRLRFRNSLGMTEGGGIAALQGARLFEKPGTCVGQVAAGVEVRIADGGGKVLPPLATGEIQVRSPQLLTCYWNRPDATRSAFEGGWFHTGDLGLFDEEGDLHIVGRLKDMIITGGENVYAAEVERALMSVPGVAEAAVIGVPDPKWGESVVAWIVPEPGVELTQARVVTQCRERMAHYKCPRHCVFAASLPRNPIGKVLKQQLRQSWSELASKAG